MSERKDESVEGFIPVLKEKLGIDAGEILILKRSDSHYLAEKSGIDVPYLTIKALGKSYDDVVDASNLLELAKQEYHSRIIVEWLDYIKSINADVDEYYDSDMYIGAWSYDKECYAEFAWNQRDMVLDYLIRTVGKAPKKIYAARFSGAGLNIVYETEDYERYNLKALDDRIKNDIYKMAQAHVEKKYGKIKFSLYVQIWHPEMKGYNGYALARQD